MEKQQIREIIEGWNLHAEVMDGKQNIELVVPSENLREIALKLKNTNGLQFDFLLSATAVDWTTHFTTVYHLTSSELHHVLALKTKVGDHENPEVDTLSDIWIAADFQEREIFDLFGIKFRGHKDLRRLFLEDDWGYPLRKDYTDDNIKELK